MRKFETKSRTRCAIALSVVLPLWACDGRAPTPVSPGETITYTLSGVVSERAASGLAPLQGATVREARAGRQTVTDATGFYSIPGVPGPTASVTVVKEGYTSGQKIFDISGDTRLDFEVSRLEFQVLSGVVFEMTPTGRVPVAGVSLYCDACGGPLGHTFVETDANGAYSFSWTGNGATPLLVRKEGYRLAPTEAGDSRDGWIIVQVDGNTRFDIELVRL